MVETETYSYDDSGIVEAETIIKLENREFVVVENKTHEKHKVFEREAGKKHPIKQWEPVEQSVPPIEE